MAKNKQAAAKPAEAVTEEVNRIPAAQFLIDSGLLFEINRTVLMPLGVALYVNGGVLDWQDCRDEADGITYDPETFAEGRAKFYATMRDWGYQKHMERKDALGYIVQEG